MTPAELRANFKKRRRESKEKLALTPELVEPEALPLTSTQRMEADAFTGVAGIREAKIVAMRMLGFSVKEIANELRLTEDETSRWLMVARRRGSLHDIGDRLQYHAAALAADKLITLIEAGDPDAILETLKGLGYFRHHSQVKTDAGTGDGIQLQVNVQLPTGVRSTADIPITGQISGQPRELSDGKATDGDEGE